MTDDYIRWVTYHYGDGPYDWAVRESAGGGRMEPFPSILTWLTRQQAEAIAAALNDLCGLNWQLRHPDWFKEAQEEQERLTRKWIEQ